MRTKEFKKMSKTIVGNLARKIAESAVHAAVFAYVSKKVTNFLDKKSKKEDKVRVEDSTKTGSNEQQ